MGPEQPRLPALAVVARSTRRSLPCSAGQLASLRLVPSRGRSIVSQRAERSSQPLLSTTNACALKGDCVVRHDHAPDREGVTPRRSRSRTNPPAAPPPAAARRESLVRTRGAVCSHDPIEEVNVREHAHEVIEFAAGHQNELAARRSQPLDRRAGAAVHPPVRRDCAVAVARESEIAHHQRHAGRAPTPTRFRCAQRPPTWRYVAPARQFLDRTP
jgi:hypothetical protein